MPPWTEHEPIDWLATAGQVVWLPAFLSVPIGRFVFMMRRQNAADEQPAVRMGLR